MDVIVDGLDNFQTRYLANDVAVKHGLPYVYGGAVATAGMVYPVLPVTAGGDRPWERAGLAGPDLRGVFGEMPPAGSAATCDTAGVLGPLIHVVAGTQASEAIKVLVGDWAAVSRDLLQIDLWRNTWRRIGVDASSSVVRTEFPYLNGGHGEGATALCGRDAVQVGAGGVAVDLAQVAERLRVVGEVQANPFLVRAALREGQRYELTLFADGRAIVKGTTEPAVARGLVARYVGL